MGSSGRLVDQSAWRSSNKSRLRAIEYFLCQAFQEPLYLQNHGGILGRLLFDSRYTEWWLSVRKNIENSTRKATLSFWAQLLFAVTAYILTIIASLRTDIGDQNTQLEISNAGLWLWLVR